MATGDLVKLGTLFLDDRAQMNPTRPWRVDSTPPGATDVGNIPSYEAGGSIEIRDTSQVPIYQISWVSIEEGDSRLLICDRNLLVNISWKQLFEQGLIEGKEVVIDNKKYLLRVLSGGEELRIDGDQYSGGRLPNEWDKWIVNEDKITSLPVPTASDLDNKQTSDDLLGEHNKLWNWFYVTSIGREINISSRGHMRGMNSARFYQGLGNTVGLRHIGWRPVLEVLETSPSPNSKIVIGGQQRKITDMHVVIDGQQRKVVEGYTIIGGVPKRWS